MVEHGRTAPVLGLAFDGLGYGPDGTLWGGEVLVADLTGFERVGHLVSVPMPGGVAADPRAVAHGRGLGVASKRPGRGRPSARPVSIAALATWSSTWPSAVRRPTTTSIGRLFDAVAALLGGRRRVSYEAQAAIELEALARTVGPGRRPDLRRTRSPSATPTTRSPSSTPRPLVGTAARRARPRGADGR